MRLSASLFCILLMSGTAILAQDQGDTKSPDLQQQQHPRTAPDQQRNEPAPMGPSSQDTSTHKKHRKRKHHNDARQASGTPAPDNQH